MMLDGITDWLAKFWSELSLKDVLIWLGLFVSTFLLSLGLIGLVLVKIPATYFSSHYQSDFLPGTPWILRWGALILKNILGVLLIVLGIVLSVPGVPGQGFLTILLGLILLDIPGKRPIEAQIISRPAVLGAANKIRARFGKPPLQVD